MLRCVGFAIQHDILSGFAIRQHFRCERELGGVGPLFLFHVGIRPNLRFKGLLSGFLSLEAWEVHPMNVRRFAGHFCDFWRWGRFRFRFSIF